MMNDQKKSRKINSYYSSGILETDPQLWISLTVVVIIGIAIVLAVFLCGQFIFQEWQHFLIKYIEIALTLKEQVFFQNIKMEGLT